jgi:hypothetical protein
MTPTAFMTDAAWEAIAEKMAKGIRAMPIIEDHPDWWVRYSVDGFGSHKKLLIVMRIFAAYLITLLIEEVGSSHVNQPFDRGVAKHGKSTMRGVLDLLLQNPMTLKTKTMNQWHLLIVGLASLRQLGKPSAAWQSSFRATNLDPRFRMDFKTWCTKIKHFLQAGSDFQLEGEHTLAPPPPAAAAAAAAASTHTSLSPHLPPPPSTALPSHR